MSEPFTIYYYPDLLLQRGAAIVRAAIPFDPVKRRHERRYQALADAQFVIERGRRYRRLLDRWTWDKSSSNHLLVHHALDGAIRRTSRLPMPPPTVIRRGTVPKGMLGIYRRRHVDARSGMSVGNWIASIASHAKAVGVAATAIDQIIAEYQVRRVARSAARQGFPKPTIHVRHAAFAVAIAGLRATCVADMGYGTIVDILTGGVHRECAVLQEPHA